MVRDRLAPRPLTRPRSRVYSSRLRQAAPWPTVSVALGAGGLGFAGIRPSDADTTASTRIIRDPHGEKVKLGAMPREEIVTHHEIDDVKWRVAETLGESCSLYREDEIAELESAFRTDDPEELQRIYDKWADRPAIERMDPPLPDCLECRQRAALGAGGRETTRIRPSGADTTASTRIMPRPRTSRSES